jgi:hypothetical protein
MRVLLLLTFASCLVLTSGGSADALPLIVDGLVGHFSFEGNADDSTSTGNNGTEFGGVGYSSGRFGQAADFDANDDYVLLPANSNWSFGTGNFSVSYWFRSSSILMVGIDERTVPEWGYSLGNGGIAVGGPSGAGIVLANAPIPGCTDVVGSCGPGMDGDWHMLTGVRTGTTVSFYFDGMLADDSTGPLMDVGTSNPMFIGRRFQYTTNGTLHGGGQFDELSIYNRALSPAEVGILYSAVPEPSTALLLGLGLTGLAAKGRRRSRS